MRSGVYWSLPAARKHGRSKALVLSRSASDVRQADHYLVYDFMLIT
jgi:hypothetical protein